MSSKSEPVASLLTHIRRLRARWRVLVLAEGLGLALATVLGVFLGAVALDNWLHLPAAARVLFLVVFLAGAMWVFFVRVVIPLRRPYTDEAVAVHLEGKLGDSHNRIINTVQLGRLSGTEGSSALLDRALEENTTELQKGPPLERALPARRALQWIGAFALIGLGVFLYAKFFPNHFLNASARLTKPLADIKPITDTTLEVQPGDLEVPMGGVAEIQIVTGGKTPDKVLLQFKRGADWERIELSPYAPNKFSHSFLDVRQSITYSVNAGDARSERYRIRAVEGPDVAGIAVGIRYPDYTGLPDRQEKEGHGDVLAPAGSHVTLTIRPNRALQIAKITVPGAAAADLKQLSRESFQWEGALATAGSFQLAFVDLKGFSNTTPIVRDFKIQPDRPPTVDLKANGHDGNGATVANHGSIDLTPDQPQAVKLIAEDDFGVREAKILAWKTEGEAPKTLDTVAGEKQKHHLEQPHALTVASLGAAVGETWTLVAEAVDFNPDPNRKAVRSQPVRVRVVSTRDLVDARLVAVSELKRGLTELIRLQQANLDIVKTIAPDFEADKVSKWADANFATLTMKHYETAATAQATIRTKATELAQKIDPSLFGRIQESLANLAARDMALASDLLAEGFKLKELVERRDRLQSSQQVQSNILEVLNALLEQASQLETEIALQTVLAGLEKIKKVEQDLQSKTPPNAQPPDAAGATALGEKQKEIKAWYVDLEKRLADTTARMTSEKIVAAQLFVDLGAAMKSKNLPPVMDSAEAALRAQQWPSALQGETQVIDSIDALLALVGKELQKTAESLAASLREQLKQLPPGTTAQENIYKALKTAEELARDKAADKKSAASKQTNVPERPIGDEMVAKDIENYLKRLQDAAKSAAKAKPEIRKDDPWNDLAYQQKMAASYQEHRDKKEIPLDQYKLTDGKQSASDQDWSKFEGAQGGPKQILKDEVPEDMQDLVGDLIEDEERLKEKIITSFMEMNTDLKDTGDVGDMDTPMGNYAMRGKTGNKMPASLNVGGRSRSGRSGPTFGELGTDTAKDMKGRPGEGLNSADQKGYVKEEKVEGDPGADPTTATGGKHAGQEQQEGEIGKPRDGDAPKYQGIADADIIKEGKGTGDIDVSIEALKRDLSSRQAQLVKRAEEVTKQFEQLFTPSADWYQGVDLMRQIEEEIRRGPSEKLWQMQEQALDKLKRVHREISPGSAYDFDVGQIKTPNPLVLNPRNDPFPKRDEEALKEYYMRLAEER